MRLDSHQHFWQYSAEAYPWIGTGKEILQRDFLPGDLRPVLEENEIDGVVAVQARPEAAENEFLLGLASDHDWILGVVGWLDLSAEDAPDQVARFAMRPKAAGLRQGLQGMADPAFCLSEEFNRGLSALHDFGLAFDLLVLPDQLPAVTRCVDRHPAQLFVLDHLGKPTIGGPAGVEEGWAKSLRELARRENVCVKLSGLITEVIPAQEDWNPDLIGPWFDVAFEAFGPDRILFGSDWPVCLLRGEYADWFQCVDFWLSGLSPEERGAIFGGNARRVYGL